MTDIMLNADHDICFAGVSGAKLLKTKLEAVAQRVKIRLLLRTGEWLPNITVGVPYREFFTLGNDKKYIDAFMKRYISETPDVTSLTDYSSEIGSDRKLSIRFSVEGNQGIFENIEIGGINVL
jgi:hypothetical protein